MTAQYASTESRCHSERFVLSRSGYALIVHSRTRRATAAVCEAGSGRMTSRWECPHPRALQLEEHLAPPISLTKSPEASVTGVTPQLLLGGWGHDEWVLPERVLSGELL